jgi:pimeloyl-ACP methyl ester carboxylesterase
MTRITAALATAALLTTTATTVGTTGITGTIDWRHCAPQQGAVMDCGTLDVPTEPTLNLVRLPATGPRKGAVLYAPGGPGKDGIQQLRDAAQTLSGLRRHFDVVAFDTRYLRAMTDLPGSCTTAPPLLIEPLNREQFDRQATRQRTAFEKCAAADRTGLFTHGHSAAVARDMDTIRAAMGERRINIMAESYGGITAAAYARQFPHRVRAMHLDSTADHTTTNVSYAMESTERMLDRFAIWCASAPSCALHGRNVRDVWQSLIRRVDRAPVPASSAEFGAGHLTGMHLQMIGSGMVNNTRGNLWQPFAVAVAQAVRGDFAAFGEQALGTSFGFSQPRNSTGWCGDGFGITSYDRYAKARRDLDRRLPGFGRASLWIGLVCFGWPYRPSNPPRPLPVADLPPLLGSGTWSDYDQTHQFVRQVPGSSTIRYKGFGHVLYISGQSPCVAGHVVRYFEHLRLPPQGTVCRPGN